MSKKGPISLVERGVKKFKRMAKHLIMDKWGQIMEYCPCGIATHTKTGTVVFAESLRDMR
jgi:hypothetical protein